MFKILKDPDPEGTDPQIRTSRPDLFFVSLSSHTHTYLVPLHSSFSHTQTQNSTVASEEHKHSKTVYHFRLVCVCKEFVIWLTTFVFTEEFCSGRRERWRYGGSWRAEVIEEEDENREDKKWEKKKIHERKKLKNGLAFFFNSCLVFFCNFSLTFIKKN